MNGLIACRLCYPRTGSFKASTEHCCLRLLGDSELRLSHEHLASEGSPSQVDQYATPSADEAANHMGSRSQHRSRNQSNKSAEHS